MEEGKKDGMELMGGCNKLIGMQVATAS
jgi:hypothetical protein